MRLKEQRLWDGMRKNAPKGWWLQRVENYVGEGMPDVYVATPDRTAWVELKAPNRPARLTTRLLGNEGLRPSQINWHIKAATKRLITWVLIRDSEGGLYLIEGCFAAELNNLSLEDFRRRSRASSWKEIWSVLNEN